MKYFFLFLISFSVPALANETLYLYGSQRESYQQEWEQKAQGYEEENQSRLNELYETHGVIGDTTQPITEPVTPPALPSDNSLNMMPHDNTQ